MKANSHQLGAYLVRSFFYEKYFFSASHHPLFYSILQF